MHSLAMRIVVAARGECAQTELAGEIANASVLGDVILEGGAQLKRFSAVLNWAQEIDCLFKT